MSLDLNLDDLGSFDGTDAGAESPRSPRSPGMPFYNPIGLTIGEISPSRSVSSSGAGSYARNQTHSVHGVHMHVQENAKIPLFNQAIDRTNSSRPSYNAGTSDSRFSMAELFLSKEFKHRQSLNLNYAGVGSFFDDTGFMSNDGTSKRSSGDANVNVNAYNTFDATGEIASGHDETQIEIDALTAAIDPTPWAEIERKMSTIEQSVTSTFSRHQQINSISQSHSHSYPNNYNPYGRHEPLPIPGKMSSPPQRAPILLGNLPPQKKSSPDAGDISQALATAAALASVGTVEDQDAQTPSSAPTSIPLVVNTPNTIIPAPSTPALLPYTKAQQTSKNVKKNGPTPSAQQHSRHRANYSPPQHATAHSTSRASVLAAANKKNQYGFGDNHSVPSVPAPPPNAPSDVLDRIITTENAPSIPNLSCDSSVGYSGAAYERKKQRAKDARVKLNDAIERLSIAMSLAGSQSKQRSNLLGSRISKTEQRTKSLQINDECVNLAEQAKKWDRPSFVSTAASLVQALNSQCESLARELICLQERLDATTGTTSGVPGSVPLPVNNTHVVVSTPKRQQDTTANTEVTNESPFKRIRTENDTTTKEVDIPSDETIIFGATAMMLDPLSLSRCLCVSRRWRDIGVFQDDSIWLQLAVKRFGFYNVRQWTEKMVDSDIDGGHLSNQRLYRGMSAANVMPHIQQTGLRLLGDAKIPGRMSGWVFMVERSNGETVRSVKREPSTVTTGTGAYQSRPVVELRIVLQNTGMGHNPIIIKNQQITVDVSTRRSGGELPEIYWDDRFSKVVKALDGANYQGNTEPSSRFDVQGELCRLGLFDAAIINLHIDAKGCSTTSKFRQRSNFTKILVSLEGTTVPMVIPFLRDSAQGH